jgi:uncharacterized membrane protein (DUF373 family)
MVQQTRYYSVINRYLLKFYHVFEHAVIVLLLIMMMVVVGTAVYDMLVLIIGSFDRETEFFITVQELHSIFGLFLLILIGIELLETIKIYLLDDSIRVEIVFLVAMIGIARHVIDLDYKNANPVSLLGMAAIIIALTVGYFLLKKSGQFPWRVQIKSRLEDQPSEPQASEE